jgi:hypothetical protein
MVVPEGREKQPAGKSKIKPLLKFLLKILRNRLKYCLHTSLIRASVKKAGTFLIPLNLNFVPLRYLLVMVEMGRGNE